MLTLIIIILGFIFVYHLVKENSASKAVAQTTATSIGCLSTTLQLIVFLIALALFIGLFIRF